MLAPILWGLGFRVFSEIHVANLLGPLGLWGSFLKSMFSPCRSGNACPLGLCALFINLAFHLPGRTPSITQAAVVIVCSRTSYRILLYNHIVPHITIHYYMMLDSPLSYRVILSHMVSYYLVMQYKYGASYLIPATNDIPQAALCVFIYGSGFRVCIKSSPMLPRSY